MAEEVQAVLVTVTVDTNKRVIQRVGYSLDAAAALVAEVREELA